MSKNTFTKLLFKINSQNHYYYTTTIRLYTNIYILFIIYYYYYFFLFFKRIGWILCVLCHKSAKTRTKSVFPKTWFGQKKFSRRTPPPQKIDFRPISKKFFFELARESFFAQIALWGIQTCLAFLPIYGVQPQKSVEFNSKNKKK